jgi:DNA-directed RNA polymerase II subunit RPB4
MNRKTEDEDANQIQFGSEFQNCQALLISEVKVLLDLKPQATPITQKTQEYCYKFSKFSNKQTVKQIRGLFPDEEYHEFEMAQLANLCVETVEEAVALIPSLQRIPEDELQSKLNELGHLRKYQ